MRLATAAVATTLFGLGAAAFAQPAYAAGPPSPAPGTHLMMDTASAPSLATVRAWQASSPYKAIGVYIPVMKSVDDRYDKVQSNLTSSWVAAVRAGGWQVLPIYVGRQAVNRCTSRTFHYVSGDPAVAAQQGREAARDAASSASALGLSAGAPIAYDMEAYTAGCGGKPMRAFYDAWTRQLHALGRMSAIYGSRNSTITDVASLPSHGLMGPDAVWAATASGQAQTTSLPPLVDGTWSGKRLNQFNLGVTRKYAGISLNIDESAVDDYVWDTTAPAVTMSTPQAAVRRSAVDITWSGSDVGGSGVARYQTRTRHAAFGHMLSRWSTPVSTGTARRRVTLGGGQEWCVQVRATDHAGNTSGWSRQVCTSRLLDDRKLHASKGWHTLRVPGSYGRSVSATRKPGSALSIAPVRARSIGVVLAGPGPVQVRIGRQVVGTVSGTGLQWLQLPQQMTGTLHLRAVSPRKTAVDGVATLV
jgi:hypothetical protein